MTVKFKDPVAAQACVKKMDGRYFGGQRVSCGRHRPTLLTEGIGLNLHRQGAIPQVRWSVVR
jgi:hypothetical protein